MQIVLEMAVLALLGSSPGAAATGGERPVVRLELAFAEPTWLSDLFPFDGRDGSGRDLPAFEAEVAEALRERFSTAFDFLDFEAATPEYVLRITVGDGVEKHDRWLAEVRFSIALLRADGRPLAVAPHEAWILRKDTLFRANLGGTTGLAKEIVERLEDRLATEPGSLCRAVLWSVPLDGRVMYVPAAWPFCRLAPSASLPAAERIRVLALLRYGESGAPLWHGLDALRPDPGPAWRQVCGEKPEFEGGLWLDEVSELELPETVVQPLAGLRADCGELELAGVHVVDLDPPAPEGQAPPPPRDAPRHAPSELAGGSR